MLKKEVASTKKKVTNLLDSQEQSRLLLENVRDYAIFTMDVDGKIMDWNEGAERIFGYSYTEILGKDLSHFYSLEEVERGDHDEELQVAALEGRMDFERWHSKKDGSLFYASGVTTVINDVEGAVVGFAKVVRDITEKNDRDEQLLRQAFHDVLTDLPNRLLFNDRLNVALQHAERAKKMVGVLFLDLDRFKDINDTHGHHVGDEVLREISSRLTNCLRSEDTVARFGGDEFLILLTDVEIADEVEHIANKIFKCLKPSIKLAAHEIQLNTSIGIAVYPTDGVTTEILIKNADNALYQAKEAGRNTYRTYEQAVHLRSSKRLTLENDMKKALRKKQFVLHYQPIFDTQTKNIVQIEALIRWHHPEIGIVLPLDFIGLADETGMILQIGEWVVEEVCSQIKCWEKAGIPSLPIGINLSARQIASLDFHKKLCAIIKKAGVKNNRFQLEISETFAMEDVEKSIAMFKFLKEVGFSISLDDFGTGHSSLSYLTRLPVDSLKIDQSFIRNCTSDTRDAAIVKTIVSLGHTLGLEVCAEGIENKEQLQLVKKSRCDTVQGFLLSEPIPLNEITALLKDHSKENKELFNK